MERRGQEQRAPRRGQSRSFYWLNAEISGRARIECTRAENHYMQKTDMRGTGQLAGTVLWVCPDCEPQVGGKWLAGKEAENDK